MGEDPLVGADLVPEEVVKKAEPMSAFGKWYKSFADSPFAHDFHQQSFDESK